MSLLKKIQQTATQSAGPLLVSSGPDVSQAFPAATNLSLCASDNSTNKLNTTGPLVPYENSDFDAFLYIVVVLSCYALSMVLLMIKYIKRENEEAEWHEIYMDYVKRDEYSKPYQQIDQRTDKMLEYVKGKLKLFYKARGISDDGSMVMGSLVYHETSV